MVFVGVFRQNVKNSRFLKVFRNMHASRIGFKDIDDFFVAVAPELSYPPSPHCGHSYIILVDVYKTNKI